MGSLGRGVEKTQKSEKTLERENTIIWVGPLDFATALSIMLNRLGLLTTQLPFLPLAGYKCLTVHPLVAVILLKHISHFYKELANCCNLMFQYNKEYTPGLCASGASGQVALCSPFLNLLHLRGQTWHDNPSIAY